jgi:23S rRNA (uridine2552-2'-O)-methyltransferase
MSAAKRVLDPVAREAKRLGFVARSALKLLELDEKFSLFRSLRPTGPRVLDLGCAPGAWIQAVHKRAPRSTHVVGVDLTEVDVSGLPYVDQSRVVTLVEDARNFHEFAGDLNVQTRPFDLILSDMMASTSGIASLDATRSLELAECAVDVALGGSVALRPNGNLVVKILEGGGSVEELAKVTKPHFEKVSWFKPKATRTESKEIYLVARGRKP